MNDTKPFRRIAPLRHAVTTLIKRARRLTQGSDNIEWFMNSVASELTRFMADEFVVNANLTKIQIDDRGTLAEAIMFSLYKRPTSSEQPSRVRGAFIRCPYP